MDLRKRFSSARQQSKPYNQKGDKGMNNYEKIFEVLIEAILEDAMNGGVQIDMAEVEKAEAMYEEL